jgi:hypothetical protein
MQIKDPVRATACSEDQPTRVIAALSEATWLFVPEFDNLVGEVFLTFGVWELVENGLLFPNRPVLITYEERQVLSGCMLD